MMLSEKLKNFTLLLASKSPRRHMLLKGAGIDFKIINTNAEETFPINLTSYRIPLYLSQKKAEAVNIKFDEKTILITADTIVWVDNNVLNKPTDREDAIRMLNILSGNVHEVFTAVTLKSMHKNKSFYVKSKVHFKTLKKQEIAYYVDTYKPYDKAGAYGIQEWIGYIGIKRVEGSFYNVMGLPITRLYHELERFIKDLA